MSRSRRYIDICVEKEDGGSRGNVLGCHDAEIAQLTKITSSPHERLGKVVPGKVRLPVSPVKMLAGRECNYSGRGRFSLSDSCHISSRYLPVNGPSNIDEMNSCAYVSQFSADGSLFVAGFQDSHIRIYNVDHGWKVQKDIRARNLQWTISDTSLSPECRLLAYSSLSPVVHIVDVGSDTKDSHANITVSSTSSIDIQIWNAKSEIHEGLEFSSNSDDYEDYSFRIFSIKFSTDGQELVAASSNESIYVYDLEAKRVSLQLKAHESDVNAVCFADETGHIIYSGSDDHLCKVWDRRCFDTREKPAGVLMGHLEGITFIDTRGDGRYFISNGKDQAIKLWDIRKMSSNVEYTPVRRSAEWDYRRTQYPARVRNMRHPDDLSVATYKGHTVLRTLIRCHFSPANSTAQKYIYTGSADSSVYIYDLVSGDQVAKLAYHEDTVRDCHWHPFYPMMVSSSWDGSIARWEFPGSGESPKPVRETTRRRRFFY